MTDREAMIRQLLEREFSPGEIVIQDDSQRHAGHAGMGDRPQQTHFTLHIVSSRFEDLNRIERHQLINRVLAPVFEDGLHALALQLHTPAETRR